MSDEARLLLARHGRHDWLAPPINPPSMSGWLNSSFAFDAFTLPPYWIRTAFAVASSLIAASSLRICA